MKLRYCLGLMFFIFIFSWSVNAVSAAQPLNSENSMVARGSAVVSKDLAAARRQAIDDTLNNALDRYIHEKMVAGHDYDELINEQILDRQDRYILSYEIISDRLLGDLLQLELNVHFNKALLQEDLATILKPEKRAVRDISLVVIQENINDQLLFEPLQVSPVLLQSEELKKQLQAELNSYGFNVTLQHNNIDEIRRLLRASHQHENAAAMYMKKFQQLMSGDLAICLEVKKFHEEKISTVHKELLTVENSLDFVDLKNRTFVVLPSLTSKSLTNDVPSGIEALSANLTKNIKNRIMDYMLQKYAVFPEHEEEIMVTISGFHCHQDYVVFKEALKNLRTIKTVALSALSHGRIELKVVTYAQRDMLLDWLNRFTPPGHSYQLQAGPSNDGGGAILVTVEYAEAIN